jgi:hypothetical protein
MKTKFLFIVFFFLVSLSFAKLAKAENMRSDSYYVQFGNFNITSGEKDSASYHLTDTVGGMAIGPYGQYGSSSYFIGSGFQYVYQIDYFSFEISKLLIDFGELYYGSFATDAHTLTITTPGASGYKVYAFENRSLESLDGGDEIRDTLCDASDCDETVAASWTNANNYGFGFNMTGDDIPSDFVNANYFRQFANNDLGEDMQTVMESNNVALGSVATVNYKASPRGDQTAGDYETSIVFVAVPGY